MRRKFRQLRPMAAFNPKVRAFVHDQRNDRLFVWKPEWAAHYYEWAFFQPDGTVEWRGWLAPVCSGCCRIVIMPLRSVKRSLG
jgi:hypothetical protein